MKPNGGNETYCHRIKIVMHAYFQLDLNDKLEYSETDSYKDGFMEYLGAWADKIGVDAAIVKVSVDKQWTKEMRGKNVKNSWFTKILQWSLEGRHVLYHRQKTSIMKDCSFSFSRL